MIARKTATRARKPKEPAKRTYQLRIKVAWRRQVSAIVETGRLLIEAKAKLGHGAWGAMFKGPDQLPFGQETARCLMAIARHPLLKSKETWDLLPPSWWTLYILSRAPVARLKDWLANGSVSCETTANEAKALYPAWSLPRTKPSPAKHGGPEDDAQSMDVDDDDFPQETFDTFGSNRSEPLNDRLRLTLGRMARTVEDWARDLPEMTLTLADMLAAAEADPEADPNIITDLRTATQIDIGPATQIIATLEAVFQRYPASAGRWRHVL
ncbi:DUF3102 domain-containing protein [Bradyrhizobium canariense]|uniref:DUF3102 domain-containing protein n=1 Tax=Bradyrhizobium canariense TaxID=255045 RepID=UPI001CA55B08|nr:DUF3102 domain-containing protein [Bradyrhizobium canariense]MBW5439700.1 DUF3102 domain-containing protein [Bradyrhizobium canariense]